MNRELARVTAERWSNLLAKGAVSRQENDQYQAQFQSQSANVEALDRGRMAAERSLNAVQSNLQRLEQLQSYKQVRAPFAGVITLRNVDVGALISGGQTLLFRIAQTDPLRAYINVPQSESKSLHVGASARLDLSQFPGEKFNGTVVRSASALTPRLVRCSPKCAYPIETACSAGDVCAGDLRQNQSHPPLLAPGDTVVVGVEGTRIATVGPNGVVEFKTVVAGRDFGRGDRDSARAERRRFADCQPQRPCT